MKRQIAVILLTPLTLAAASTGVWGEDLFYRTEQIAQQKALQLRIDDMQQGRERQQQLLQRLDDLTARVDALERQLQHAR
ncbi:hypothetical protein [Pararobbsia alpina]|uniref:Uncharacterized protein n=1 Tax=Pararobbsia alpina TaxID=621374 RepID=A0A6S7ASL7_9BURK|nr:hypothetical protein [Pararobbsia alpina]CAB3775737.1 hypothetical protein LMG28138_00004 [Pararobbsia alpina]